MIRAPIYGTRERPRTRLPNLSADARSMTTWPITCCARRSNVSSRSSVRLYDNWKGSPHVWRASFPSFRKRSRSGISSSMATLQSTIERCGAQFRRACLPYALASPPSWSVTGAHDGYAPGHVPSRAILNRCLALIVLPSLRCTHPPAAAASAAKPRSRSAKRSSTASRPMWKRTVGPPGAQRVAVRAGVQSNGMARLS